MEIPMTLVYRYIILTIILFIIYLLIYRKKGANISFTGYFNAIIHYINIFIASLFFIAAIAFIYFCFTYQIYPVLIAPVGFFFASYIIVKKALNADFNLNIHIISKNSNIYKHLTIMNVVLFMFFSGCLFVNIILFSSMIPDISGQNSGPIPMIIIGLIMLSFNIFVGYLLFSSLTGKIKFVPVDNGFNNVTYKLVKNYNIDINDKNNISNIVLIFSFLLGLLFIFLGIKDYETRNFSFLLASVFISFTIIFFSVNLYEKLKTKNK